MSENPTCERCEYCEHGITGFICVFDGNNLVMADDKGNCENYKDIVCHKNCYRCEKYPTAKAQKTCPTVKMRIRIVNRSIYQMRKAAKKRAEDEVKG